MSKEPKIVDFEESGICVNKKCNREYDDYGHNGLPLFNGRVCDNCNILVVLDRLIKCTSNKEDKDE